MVAKEEFLDDLLGDVPDNSKDFRDIKRTIEVEVTDCDTTVIAVAISKQADNNRHLKIPAVMGSPISHVVHDHVRDQYGLFAVDYHLIGTLPIAFRGRMRDVVGWELELPLPLSVIKRYMSPKQKRQFDMWRTQYPEGDYDISFIQTLNGY